MKFAGVRMELAQAGEISVALVSTQILHIQKTTANLEQVGVLQVMNGV
jgi:hypothetical protein